MRESTAPCWLARDREHAEEAVARLREHGIEAEIAPPGTRYAHVGEGRWEVRVAASRVAQAHALLAAARG